EPGTVGRRISASPGVHPRRRRPQGEPNEGDRPVTRELTEIPRCGRPKANGQPCMRRGGPCFEHATAEEERESLEWAQQEVKRRDVAEREWLGATTQGRPAFEAAELLDQQGIPSC